MDAVRKLLLTLLAQLPLLSALDRWRDQAKQHPIAAISFAVLYEIAVFAIAFGKEVWGILKPELAQFVAAKIGSLFRSVSIGFGKRYRQFVVNEHGIFNVRGLGLISTFTLELEQVFVDLRVAPSSNPQRATSDIITTMQRAGNRPIWDFLRITKDKPNEALALAVIGPPGCGKTTLLQHVAITLAAHKQRRYRFRSYLPILLYLRDHSTAILDKNPPSLALLVETVLNNPSGAALNPPPGWFERQLKHGKCLILLDGLDEVAGLEQRQAVALWVDQQIKNYPLCRFVLSARPQGYRDAPLQRAHVLEVQPFNMEQVRKFIENWYAANEIMRSGGRNTPLVRQRANREAQDLLRRLRRTPSLSALTVNPLLLTMIAMVHRYHGALPGSRVELYAEICEVLLGRWRHSKGVKDALSAAQKLVVLRPLAASMMERKLRDIDSDQAIEIISPYLKRVGITGKAVKRFLYDAQFNTGLILEREAGYWSFAHLTFQEYLTAAHWLDGKKPLRELDKLVVDSWWHETLRLYAAQGDATSVVEACLFIDSISTLSLAADCSEESRELDPIMRQYVIDRIVSDLESPDHDRRRLAAEVQLSRRLKMLLQRIDDERSIDLTYLTCSEYQLFIDELRQQGEFRQPDHWSDFGFESNHALSPITGLRFEDAQAFCEWLTQREGGGITYRLPTPDEASKWKGEPQGQRGTWCAEIDEPFLADLDESHLKPFLQRISQLSEASLPSRTKLSFAVDRYATKVAFYYRNRDNLQTFAIAIDRGMSLNSGRGASPFDLKKSVLRFQSILQARRLIARISNSVVLKVVTSETDLKFQIGLLGFIFTTLLYWALGSLVAALLVMAGLILAGIVIYTLSDAVKLTEFLRAIDMDRAIDNSVENVNTPDRAFVRTPPRNKDSTPEKDALTLLRAKELIDILSLDLFLDIYRALDRSLDVSGSRSSRRAGHLNERGLYRFLYPQVDEYSVSLQRLLEDDWTGRDPSLPEYVRSLTEKDPELKKSPFVRLLSDVIACAEASTPNELLKAERRFVATIIEFALLGYGGIKEEAPVSRILSWFRGRNIINELREQQDALLELFWWLQIVVARTEGEPLQWDGIRLVKETAPL